MKHLRIMFISLLFVLIAFICFPSSAFSAEVLQVRSSSILQIGDRNRSYIVKLACIAVDPENELSAISWLKSNLRRGKRVNFKPEGSENGALLARVSPIDSNLDLGESLIREGYATFKC